MKDPMALVVRWLILSAAVWVAAELISGIHYDGAVSILVVAAILGLMNLYVRPVLAFFTLPITCLTLGLFLLLLNAAMLGLAAWLSDLFGVRFSVDNFGSALLGAIIISVVGFVLSQIFKPDRLGSDF